MKLGARTRLGQYFGALRNPAARDELKRLGDWYSNSAIQQACEQAWKLPGLGAMGTMDEVRAWLEANYPMVR